MSIKGMRLLKKIKKIWKVIVKKRNMKEQVIKEISVSILKI
jgi:hypothetical protein